ncbi:MAG: type II toxin-antitoxin system VapC family toxin [Acidobacteria bacterium]|nr:type II toxin-antitoxin system VapC family toxin [Acidobacteriota bacterium]
MRFWDSSALVALFVRESRSAEVLALLQEDREILVSILARVEITSALWRRTRARQFASGEREIADDSFKRIASIWTEVGDFLETRGLAVALLAKYPLRTGDAIQLASAVQAANGNAAKLPFVTLDHDLAVAAMAEGFPVLP